MAFSKNMILITLRVCLLTVFIILSVVSIYETSYKVTPVMLALLACVTAAELIWYLGRTERTFTLFLLSIKHQDFSRNYQGQETGEGLQKAFKLITQSFEDLETRKHAEYRLLQTVSEHLNIGLACYTPEGKVIFSNKAFREMLKLNSFSRMETLRKQHGEIYDCMFSGNYGSEQLIETRSDQRVLVKTEAFTLQDERFRLVSLYDIRSTLDTNELESYQKLMKVMTHEIMNSATPILSLVQVVNRKLVKDDQLKTLPEKDQKNVAFSLRAVETRTAGILKFVEAYRRINKSVQPVKKIITVKELVEPVVTLLVDQTKVQFRFRNETDEPISVDPHLMSQVLINLLKNALEATAETEHPAVEIGATTVADHFCITVEDNGKGIAEAHRKELFVPFFTTRAEGSGVGLALSRKIVNAHGGSLSYQPTEGGKTRFVILLVGE